jgi:hypothetical protein
MQATEWTYRGKRILDNARVWRQRRQGLRANHQQIIYSG